MRLAKWSVIALLSAACTAGAADPPQHRQGPGGPGGSPGGGPSRGSRANEPDGGRGENRSEGGRPRSGFGGGFDRSSWGEMKDFFKKYSPNRWEDIERSSQGPRRDLFPNLMMSMGGRYRDLQSLNAATDAESKKLYQVKIDQIWCEDTEYGLLKKIKDLTAAGNTAEADKLKAELAPWAAASIRFRLEDRAMRVERLERMMELEKKAIKSDLAHKDDLLKDRLAKMEAEGPDFFIPPPRPRGEGKSESPGVGAPTPLLPADGVKPANAAP